MAVNRKPKTDNRTPITEFGRIGVLMGGLSSEREISLKSGKAVFESLKQLDADVVTVDINTDNVQDNIRLIKSYEIDCAFLALHGRFGEDGQMQSILEAMNIPYTGSGILASKLAMDKIASRKIFEVYGLSVPKYKVADKSFFSANWRVWNSLSLPLVIKPATQGSSIGLSIIEDKKELAKAVELALSFDESALIEECIEGREITVGILDDKPLPVIEIIPKKRFFDYEAKYQHGMTDYIVPAELDDMIAKRIQCAAMSAHKLLGCFGCSRVDIILNKVNIPFILEVNSIPGLTPTSLLPKAAKIAGIEFSELCLKLVELAYEKENSKCAPHRRKKAGFIP